MIWRPTAMFLTAGLLIGCSSPPKKTSAGARAARRAYAQTDTTLLRGPYAWSDRRWEAYLNESGYSEYVIVASTSSLRTATLDAQTILERFEIPSRLTMVDKHMYQLFVPPSQWERAARILEADAYIRSYWLIRP